MSNLCGIYCIECLVNHKKYIGESKVIKQRWGRHKRELNANKHSNWLLQKDWDLYGSDNFIFYIVEECPDDELYEKEKYWISEYDTYENGYNITSGGLGSNDIKHSDKWRNYFSEHMKWRHEHDENYINKVNESRSKQMKPIACYDPNGYIRSYEGIGVAARALNMRRENISDVLYGRRNTNLGYTFSFDEERLSPEEITKRFAVRKNGVHRKIRKVATIDEAGNIIKSYKSITEASKDTGISVQSICRVCLGQSLQAHGLLFKYLE